MARVLFQSRKPLFWEQIRQGQLAGDAGEAVGASATCGRWWFRAKSCRGETRCERTKDLRAASTADPRGTYRDTGRRPRRPMMWSIADRLKRAPSTIKREIDNNTELRTRKNPKKSGYRRKHAFGANQSGASAKVAYRAMAAHDRSADRARRP